MPAMQGLLKLSLTSDEFDQWVPDVMAKHMGKWKPIGGVQHNTGKMVWPGYDSHGIQITPAQRMDNMSVDWVSRHFTGGPQFLASKSYIDEKTKLIVPAKMNIVWPPWMFGTHSPEFDDTRWGMESTGDFNLEPMPDDLYQVIVRGWAALYKYLGHPANSDNFKYHKEDPGTTHKQCPGKAMGTKEHMIATINSLVTGKPIQVNTPTPVVVATAPKPDLNHVNANHFSDAMETKLMALEAFREKSYNLKGIWHVGYGFRDGFRGLHVDANTIMTKDAADKYFKESVDIMGDTMNSVIKVPLQQYQFDALGILAWNIGVSALDNSTIMKRLNALDYKGAGDAFLMWDKWRETPTSPLTESPQLKTRRLYEQSIFNGDVKL